MQGVREDSRPGIPRQTEWIAAMTSDPDSAYDDRPDREDRFNAAVTRYLEDNRDELIAEWTKKNPGEPWDGSDLFDLAAEKVERLFSEPITDE
jgi:hypothetical protein